MNLSRPPSYYVNAPLIRDVLERNLLAHDDFAEELGLSRSHWSVIFNGHQALSKSVRRRLLANPRLQGIPESDLWHASESREAK